MKVSDYIIKFINEKMGVNHVFMLSGGGWMHQKHMANIPTI